MGVNQSTYIEERMQMYMEEDWFPLIMSHENIIEFFKIIFGKKKTFIFKNFSSAVNPKDYKKNTIILVCTTLLGKAPRQVLPYKRLKAMNCQGEWLTK